MAIDDLYVVTTSVRTAESVMSFQFAYLMELGTVGPATLTALATKFVEDKLDLYALACSDQLEVDQCRVDVITNGDDLPGFVNLNNLEGALTGQMLPNSSAAVASLITTAPNSKHNGRMYLPGCTEGNQADGIMTGGQVTLWNTFTTALLLDIVLDSPEDAEFTPVVVSRVLDGVPRATPVGFNLLSSTVGEALRQQRRRGGKRFGLAS